MTGYAYLGSLIFIKNAAGYAFESAQFGGGRIIHTTGTIAPAYYTTDHLGSVRMITDANGTIQEQNDYYPFGGRHTTGNTYAALPGNNHKFNGKEEQTIGATGYLDYGARMYDNVTGRWGTPDPLAEKYKSMSPYNYCLNNPVRLIDPNGKEPILGYVGTVSGFIKFMNGISTGIGKATGSAAHDAMLRMGMINGLTPANTAPFNSSGGNRYIYTKKGGWIDMTHFMFYAGRAYNYKQEKNQAQEFINSNSFALMHPETQAYWFQQAGKSPVGEAVQDGYLQEFADKFTAPYSAYSYEDLPTDKFGADFGANYFDPNSNLTFATQIQNYLNNKLKATNPEIAPNYNSLPCKYPNKKPTIQNKTTKPLFTIE